VPAAPDSDSLRRALAEADARLAALERELGPARARPRDGQEPEPRSETWTPPEGWDERRIAETIARFPRWHYRFDLKGQVTPIFDEDHVNRHEQRRRYFFEPLVEHYGGSLAGKRVLDLGCNAGFWSLMALEAGCDFVWGIDGRATHIDQARFVLSVEGVDPTRYRLTTANVFDLDLLQEGPFDLVLCLGLLYHVAKPVELLESVASVNTDLLLVDTALSRAAGPYLEIRREPADDPRMAVEGSLVLRPSREAMLALASSLGYSVGVLKPDFSDYTGCADYEGEIRRAFVCARRAGLDGSLFRLEEPPRSASADQARHA
jgi:tRNA (mo5U34)-methyltransferase